MSSTDWLVDTQPRKLRVLRIAAVAFANKNFLRHGDYDRCVQALCTCTISRSKVLAVWLEMVSSPRRSNKPPSLSAGKSLSVCHVEGARETAEVIQPVTRLAVSYYSCGDVQRLSYYPIGTQI